MRFQLSLMASAALACLAPNTDAGSVPIDGQIALTAFNNGDGTWAVKRGPSGPVLRDGLAREEALAIVGGLTGPYSPSNVQEAVAAGKRAEIERQEAEREAATSGLSDAEVSADTSEPSDAGLAEENAELRSEVESLREELAALRANMAPPTPGEDAADDAKGGLTKDEVIKQLTDLKVEFDPKAKKADLVALLAAQPASPPPAKEGEGGPAAADAKPAADDAKGGA